MLFNVTSRVVDVNPFEPTQLHVPSGPGPSVRLFPRIALMQVILCHAPPLSCKLGIIAVGVQFAELILNEVILSFQPLLIKQLLSALRMTFAPVKLSCS